MISNISPGIVVAVFRASSVQVGEGSPYKYPLMNVEYKVSDIFGQSVVA
jgi:hypothetical protein